MTILHLIFIKVKIITIGSRPYQGENYLENRKKIIDIFLKKLDDLDHLDFAGGTGRVTEYLQKI